MTLTRRVLAPVLVHGATGFTGKLICAALRRRGIPFAVSGRDAAKLAELAEERCVVDLERPASLQRAIAGRTIVCAAAGPFVDLGEPVLAACARSGVHYVDTTAEQVFIARMRERYDAVARETGACIVPAIGFGGALGDWLAHALADEIGGAPDAIATYYGITGTDGRLFGTSRGSKRSALAILTERSLQWVDGALVAERPGYVVRDVGWLPGAGMKAVSFPAPDPLTFPSHTGARSVRAFVVVTARMARAVRIAGRFAPLLARIGRVLFARTIARSPEGPDPAARSRAVCQIRSEVTKGGRRLAATLHADDPYGLTGELAAYAVDRALAGGIRARGVVPPSVAFEARAALAALQALGVGLEWPGGPQRDDREACEATAS